MIIGTDISAWQSDSTTTKIVDFKKMADAGAKFSFFRAQFGLAKDRNFDEYVKNSKGLIKRGAYFFPIVAYNLEQQANQFCDIVAGLDLELPPVIDIENYNGVPSASSIKSMINIVESRLNRKPIIYTGYYVWRDNVAGSSDPYFAKYPLWIATYGAKPMVPSPWTNWDFWQYTDKGDGYLFGVESANIDMDNFNGTEQDFNDIFGGTENNNNNGGTTVTESTMPKFSYVFELHKEVDLEKLGGQLDGLISLAVDRTRTSPFKNEDGSSNGFISPTFTAQIDWADKVRPSIPLIALAAVDSGEYVQFPYNDYDKWPQIDRDPVMADLKRAIFTSNGYKRGVHAIIFDMRKLTEGTTDKIVPVGRILKVAERLQKLAWDNWKIFTMVLTSEALLTQPEYQDAQSKADISNFFMDKDEQGQSAVGECITWIGSKTVDSGNDIHFPLPTDNPNAHVPYAPAGNRLLMWWFNAYSNPCFKANGYSVMSVCFTSMWKASELYKKWSFVPKVSTSTDTGSDTNTDTGSNTGTDTSTQPSTSGLRAEIIALLDKYKIV